MIHLPRAVLLAAGIAAALALYFVLSLYLFPQSFLGASVPTRPEPVITNASFSSPRISLGESFLISVRGTNAGDDADYQVVSIGFPNLTRTSDVEVLRHDFRQTPLRIEPGNPVASGYSGRDTVAAQYPSIEAYSRPWDRGSSYAIELQVKPQSEGIFVVYVKSVALPHTWDGAHYPQEGLVDYQRELVESFSVQVTKS